MKNLETRLNDELSRGQLKIGNKAKSRVLLRTVYAESYLAIGQLSEAVRDADTALDIIKANVLDGKYDRKRGETTKESTALDIITLGRTKVDEKSLTQSLSLPVLGVLAIAHAKLGNTNFARQYAKTLEAIPTGDQVLSGGDFQRRYLAARTYYALGDIREANRAIANKNFNLWSAVAYGTQALAIVTGVYTALDVATRGGVKNTEFVNSFEPKFFASKLKLQSGLSNEALKGFEKILSEPKIKGFGLVHFGALHGKGMALNKLGRTDDAIRNLEASATIIESQRSSLNIDQYKIDFVADKQEVYADLIAMHIDANQPAAAFEWSEQAKARALVDILASRKLFRGNTNSRKAANGTLAKISKLERQLFTDATNSNSSAIKRVAEIKSLTNDIKRQSPELASLISVQPVSVAEIQTRLSDDETLLEFFGYRNKLFAFVVTKTSVRAERINGASIEKDVLELRKKLINSNSDSYEAASRRLYRELIVPVRHLLTGNVLTIVPHGPLHYLPFAALMNKKGKFLLDEFVLRLLPSATVLNFLENKKKTIQQSLLALGNPDLNNPKLDLPGAQSETEAINILWPNTTMLLRKNASEANFKKLAPGVNYLHLASHGLFDREKPLQSKLALSSGNGEDGHLTVGELYNMTIDAELVTLSACETGLGDVSKGDDVIGLNRGFLFAGAKSVISSLWNVSDLATSLMMKKLYFNLKKQGKADALRNAQISTRRTYPHPLFWAAFQLNGGL